MLCPIYTCISKVAVSNRRGLNKSEKRDLFCSKTEAQNRHQYGGNI